MKKDIDPRKLKYVLSIGQDKLYQWLRDQMEQAGMNIHFLHHDRRTTKTVRILTALWSERFQSLYVELEENRILIITADCQLQRYPGGPNPPNYHHERKALILGGTTKHVTHIHDNHDIHHWRNCDNYGTLGPSSYPNMPINRQSPITYGHITNNTFIPTVQ